MCDAQKIIIHEKMQRERHPALRLRLHHRRCRRRNLK